MHFVAKTLALVLSLMAVPAAYGECTNHYVADCGEFYLLNVVCKTTDNKGRPTGGSETLNLQYHNEPKNYPLDRVVYNDVAVYHLDLNSDGMQVVTFASQILTDIKGKGKYSTYASLGGMKSDEHECKEYK